MNIYEMGLAATNIVLTQLNLDIPQETVQELVHKANQHYKHNITS